MISKMEYRDGDNVNRSAKKGCRKTYLYKDRDLAESSLGGGRVGG